jgi:hypothetical protein
MKKIFLLLITVALFVSGKVDAQPSCQSLTSNIISASGKVLSEVGKLTESAARKLSPYILTAATGIPQFSTSADARRAISDFAGDAIAAQINILKAIGEIDGDGKGSIGARHIYIPTQRVSGELLTERTFIVTPSSYHRVTVKIKKLDGKGGANIAACAKWADGREYNVLDRKFFVDGENNIGSEQSWVFNNMNDKWLTIHLVKTGGALNKFDYQLSIEGEHDAAKLPKPESKNNGNANKEADEQLNKMIQPNTGQQINPAAITNEKLVVDTLNPDNKVSVQFLEYEVKSPRDMATGQASGKRQHGTEGVGTTTQPQPGTKEPSTKDTTKTQTSKTASGSNNNNLKQPTTQQQTGINNEKNCCDTLIEESNWCCPAKLKNVNKAVNGVANPATSPGQNNRTGTGNPTTPNNSTGNNKLKDPFTPGSPDDDLRNPFDTTKKIKPLKTQKQ